MSEKPWVERVYLYVVQHPGATGKQAAAALGTYKTNASTWLKILYQGGYLSRERAGGTLYYTATDKSYVHPEIDYSKRDFDIPPGFWERLKEHSPITYEALKGRNADG